MKPLLIGMLLLALLGCGSRETPVRRPAASFGRPCPTQVPGDVTNARVFVEVAELEFDGTRDVQPGPQQSWLDDPRIELVWSAHLLASNGHAARLAWHDTTRPPAGDRCVDGNCRILTVKPELEPARPGQLNLELRLDASDPPGGALAETTVVLGDQQLVVLAIAGKPGRVLAVTPYVVGSDQDLQRLMQCKRALQSRSRS